MSKRHGRRGPQGPQTSQGLEAGQAARPPASAQGRPQAPRHGPGGQQQSKGQSWVQVRDAIRRELEVALQSLSFLERFGEGLDSQRRLFVDFPRVTEELRTGAMERLAAAMERIYESGQGGLDLSRFLRDLPLALGHLAAAEFAAHRQKQAQASAANQRATAGAATGAANETLSSAEGSGAPAAGAHEPASAGSARAPAGEEGAIREAASAGSGESESASVPAESTGAPAASESSGAATGAAQIDSSDASAGSGAASAKADLSPRVELRARLLAAAPQLSKAAQSFRRNTSTVRRAASPRRAIGPWRSDREVLDQARRAVEFASKIYDAYAEAWNDAPLAKNAGAEAAAEMDRFLAWTQLSRYAEVARAQSAPGAKPPHEAAPGVKSDKPSPSQPPPPATADAHVEEAAQVQAAPEVPAPPSEP